MNLPPQRCATKIVSPGHPLHHARVRPLGFTRSAILLGATAGYPAASRLVVPQGMLADDVDPDGLGTVRTIARSELDGATLYLRTDLAGGTVTIRAQVPYGGAAVRGLLSLNGSTSNVSASLRVTHPATGAPYIVRPADLAKTATLAQDDAGYAGTRSLLCMPGRVLDGARVRVTGRTQAIPWPFDPNNPSRCNADDTGLSGKPCDCTATGREVQLIDDTGPVDAVQSPIANNQIVRAGTLLYAGPNELASDLPVIRTVCLRCSRLAPIGDRYCTAHR
jgi:hypothetical protein